MRVAGSTTCPLPGNRRSGEPLAQHFPHLVFTQGRHRESGGSQPFEEAQSSLLKGELYPCTGQQSCGEISTHAGSGKTLAQTRQKFDLSMFFAFVVILTIAK